MGVDLMAGAAGGKTGLVTDRAPRVGVFDSGMGGLTVFSEVCRQIPGAELTYIADDAGFPYGPLSDDALIKRVIVSLDPLLSAGALDLVIIACNTASTLALPVLRANYTIPFVGTVPAIKTAAAMSRSRSISVLATPGTVRRDYTRELIATHAADCRVTLVGAPDLAFHAEAEMRGEPIADQVLAEAIAPCFVDDGDGRTDTVVLACTHYPLLLERFKRLAPWPVNWIDPAPAIARRAASLAGAIATGSTNRIPQLVLTSGRSCPPALRSALIARGIEPDVTAITEPPRIAAC